MRNDILTRGYFISVVILTTPEEFEKGALFLRLGLPSIPIRHQNGAFRNSIETGGIWKRRLSVLVWTENKAFRKRWPYDNHVISLPVSLKHKCKMTGDCCVFKFLPRSVDAASVRKFFQQHLSHHERFSLRVTKISSSNNWKDLARLTAPRKVRPKNSKFYKCSHERFCHPNVLQLLKATIFK